MIKAINFGHKLTPYETKEYSDKIKNNKPNELQLIKSAVETSANTPLDKGILYDKIGKIYQDSESYQKANLIYRSAVKTKLSPDVSMYELFKSYIALGTTYDQLGNEEASNKIDEILYKRADEAGDIEIINRTEKEQKQDAELFVKTALKLSDKLLKINCPQSAKIIFDEASKTIDEYKIQINNSISQYNNLKAVINEKNNLFDESSKIHKELMTSDSTNNLFHRQKIIENMLSSRNFENIDEALDKHLSMSDSISDIVENLFLRANYEILKNNPEKASQYVVIASNINDEVNPNTSVDILQQILLKNNGEIEKSSNLCIKNLKILEKNNLYSKEFAKTLMNLAANNYIEYQNDKKNHSEKLGMSKNAYKNALRVSEIINDRYTTMQIVSELAEIETDQSNYKNAAGYANYLLKNTDINIFKANAYKILGNIDYKNNKFSSAMLQYEKEREYLLKADANKEAINKNLEKLISTANKQCDTNKASEYANLLKESGTVRYQDLIAIADSKAASGDYKKAQEYYEQASNLENEDESNKAIALFNVGIMKLQTSNEKSAFTDMEKGCEELEKIVKKDKYSNARDVKVLMEYLNSLGGYYYFKKSNYDKALEKFKKIYDIHKEQSVVDMPESFKNTVETRVGGVYYKKGDYDTALQYFESHLKNVLKDPNWSVISSCNRDFVSDIVSKKDANECKKIARNLETLGVLYVKTHRYLASFELFDTARQIREDVGGERLALAEDYKALARLCMITTKFSDNGMDNSQAYFLKSLNILKEYYGNNNEKVKKEEEFFNKYYSQKFLQKANKFLNDHKYLFNVAKDAALNSTNIKIKFLKDWHVKNTYLEDILNDFNLQYKDLAICE